MLGTNFFIITLFSLCAHSSPLGKEVKQERNLRVRKKKTTKKRERMEKEEEIRRIKKKKSSR